MTQLDTVLTELAGQIRALPIRAQAALFWACSDALAGGFLAWADRTGANTEPLLRAGQSAAYNFAAFGVQPSDATQLLNEIEAHTPSGDSPDEVPTTTAQDCWICADVGVRVWVAKEYDPGPAIEYALEPILGIVTEALFGITQVGSGLDEVRQMELVMQDQRVMEAVDFVTWAINLLDDVEPDERLLGELRGRSGVLLP